MVRIVHGQPDEIVERFRSALEDYEKQYAGSEAALYRQNPASVRVRILDRRFEGMARDRRHDDVWHFLEKRVEEDDMTELTMLLLLSEKELRSSLLNHEFDHPLPADL